MRVENGIERTEEIKKSLQGARVGLVTTPAGVNRNLTHSIDVLLGLCDLRVLFSPEHGIRGDKAAGAGVEDTVDSRTGIIAYSIYGGENRPTADMLDKIDAVVFDVFDVGCRCYTFISTLRNIMEECARHAKRLVVLDRVNPIGGHAVEGNILDMRFSSFVGSAPIPPRHGMTVGELALFFRGECDIACDLDIVRISGWNRDRYFDECGLIWIYPSPNIPTCDTAVLYPGISLFEGANLSEGRGSAKPFEIVGAPWLDAYEAAERLNELDLSGVTFRPVFFEPNSSKHAGALCQGVQIHVTDRRSFAPVATGVRTLFTLKDLSGDHFEWLPSASEKDAYFIDLLAGTDAFRDPALSVDDMLRGWQSDAASFARLREKYLLY